MAKPTERTKPIVDRQQYYILRRGQVTAIVESAFADGVAAAVNPHHDRPALTASRDCLRRNARPPDVQKQTVLITNHLTALAGHSAEGAGVLHARRFKRQCLARSLPARRRL